MTDARGSQHWRHSVACPQCQYALPPFREIVWQYFLEQFVTCPQCQAQVDLWASLLADVKDVFAPWSLRALGASETTFHTTLSAGELKMIDLVRAGVPQTSEILAVHYTPMGGDCFPVETHGNMPAGRWLEKRIGLVGAPLQEAQPGPSTILVSVYWISESDDTEPWLLIANALAAASRRDWPAVVPAAHGAVEIALSHVIRDVLSVAAGKDAVKRFMQNDLTSSSALNVILPLLCTLIAVPLLPEEIRGRLTRLRALRNDLAHEGLGATKLKDREVRELLVAAVFAFEFIRFTREAIVSTVRDQAGTLQRNTHS